MDLSFKFEDFVNYADHLAVAARDQVPFALSLALNDAAYDTKAVLTNQTWPAHVQEFNHNFISAALVIVPSTKEDLEVAIIDRFGRARLAMHETGGTKTPQKAKIAVPVEPNVKRTGSGEHPRPRDVANSFVIDRGRGPVLYKRTGKGKSRGLKLMYVLKSQVPVPAAVPFHADFNSSMIELVQASFPRAMMKAMLTRR